MSLLCVLISILMLFTGCNSAQNSRIDSASNFGEHPQEDSAVLTIHGILEEKTEDQLFEQSSLVVIGTVQDAGNAFQVKSSAGDLCNFTDYTLAIDTVLRGEHEKNELIVRINGGTAGGVTEVYTPSPELKIGEDYLLFLYQPARGGSFNTKGDYYCILGLTQGVFQKTKNTVSAKIRMCISRKKATRWHMSISKIEPASIRSINNISEMSISRIKNAILQMALFRKANTTI